MGLRLSGINPLSYGGVEPSSPPNVIIDYREPNSSDSNFHIGDIWLVGNLNGFGVFDTVSEVWILSIINGLVATWTQIYPLVSSGAGTFPANIGTATAIGNILNVLGINHITTTGSGNTITISLTGDIADSYVTNAGTAHPAGGILDILGGNVLNTTASGSTVVLHMDNGTNGQLLIGGNGDPVWANVTSTGGTVAITNGPNSLNLEAASPLIAVEYQADSGFAVPAAGIIDYLGSININTFATPHSVAIALDDDVLLGGFLNAGTTVNAGTGLIVNSGGITSTGTTVLHSLGAGVMQTDALGVVSSTNGTNGELLIGSNTVAPAWNTITSIGGTVSITNGANSINLETSGGGGTIGTGPAFLATQYNYLLYYTNLGITLGEPPNLTGQYPMTVFYDQDGNFFIGTLPPPGVPASFTAPTTGRYYLDFYCSWSGPVSPATTIIKIITPARTYQSTAISSAFNFGIQFTQSMAVCADMNAGDKATYYIQGAVISNGFRIYFDGSNNSGHGLVVNVASISGYKVS